MHSHLHCRKGWVRDLSTHRTLSNLLRDPTHKAAKLSTRPPYKMTAELSHTHSTVMDEATLNF